LLSSKSKVIAYGRISAKYLAEMGQIAVKLAWHLAPDTCFDLADRHNRERGPENV